ncbi:serpin B4-like [Zophobas morio]|uniref:serpin B4-like n=1 Tax=Zophobas morio TaxID=2755281 RepID=UPI003082A61D
MCLSFCNCRSPEQLWAETVALEAFITGSNTFTTNVHLKITPNFDNFIISPFFVEVICVVAQKGSKYKTNLEIRTTLNLPSNLRNQEMCFKVLMPILVKSKLFDLCAVSKLYLCKTYTIRKNLRVLAKKIYYTDVESIDFADKETAVNVINTFLRTSTNDKIVDVVNVSDLFPDMKMLLLSAVFLQGHWLNPFQSRTINQNFFTTETQVIKVVMMETVGYFNCYESKEIRARYLELRFEDELLSMVVVLPFEKEGLEEVEQQMDAIFACRQFALDYVKVSLPKFFIDTSIDFRTTLSEMGMKVPFSDQANFTGLVAEKDVFITQVIQSSRILVNEAGLDVEFLDNATKKSFKDVDVKAKVFCVDHPFFFYIKWKDLVVFTGRVKRPVLNL